MTEPERSYFARQVGSLALTHIRNDSPMAPVRAAAWFNAIARLGMYPPLFVVHDLGLLFTSPRGTGGYSLGGDARVIAGLGLAPEQRALLESYVRLLEMVAGSEVVERLAGWRLRDDLVAVLLTRALGDVCKDWQSPVAVAGGNELPLDVGRYADNDYGKMYQTFDDSPLWSFLEELCQRVLHVYTSIELIDLDTVRLLGLFREDTAHGTETLGKAIDIVDLFSAMGSPEAADVANFSLDLLPSVLETKRASGAQTFAIDGYSSVERKGHVDSLMLSELAFDEEIFEQKVVDQELLYFGHERQREDERRLQYVLVDSSASMRGKRQVFGRGLALALVKKLALQGDEIWFRFFDSRLHELHRTTRGVTFPVPYMLSFRSESGRNYSRVFQQLLLEISRLHREQHREVVLHIITHGQCHIPTELVAALSQQCHIYGIIILPSSELTLDFLPMLHRYQIVDSSVFTSRSERRDRALNIVDDAAARESGAGASGSFPALAVDHGS